MYCFIYFLVLLVFNRRCLSGVFDILLDLEAEYFEQQAGEEDKCP
jgi:hypothetical protein